MNGLNIGQLWASLGLDTSMFNKQINQVNGTLTKTSNNMQATAAKLRSFGWLASTTITAPMVLATKSIATAGMEFEYSMKKMIGLAGVASGEISGLSKVVKELAVSTGVGPQELAETLYFIESSGLKGARALEALDMAAKGSAAGMGEAKDLANLLTGAMNAYETEGLTAARVMDVLTASIREGKAEPAAMVTAFGTILPIAQELGVSIEEVGGALAVMTLTTSSTANSATYLRNILFKILNPIDEVKDAFIGMKTSVEEVQVMLREKGFDVTMKYLDELTRKYGKTMADIFPEMRALSGALNYTGQAAEKTAGIMGEVDKSTGDFGRNYEEMAKTWKKEWDRSVSSIKVSAIDLGTAVLPYLTKMFDVVAGALKRVTDSFMSLSPEMQKLILGFAAFMAVLGPLSLLVSTTMYIFIGLIPVVNLLGAAIIGLANAMLFLEANPLVLLATTLALVALITYLSICNVLVGELTDVEKAHAAISGLVADGYAKEAAAVKKLHWEAMNKGLSDEKRLKAIKELNAIMPEANFELSKEGELLSTTGHALDDYLNALYEKIRLKVIEEQLTKKMEAVEKARLATLEAQYAFDSHKGGSLRLQNAWEDAAAAEVLARKELKGYMDLFNTFSENPSKVPVLGSGDGGKGGNGGKGGDGGGEIVKQLSLIEAKELEIAELQKVIEKERNRDALVGHNYRLSLLQDELKALNTGLIEIKTDNFDDTDYTEQIEKDTEANFGGSTASPINYEAVQALPDVMNNPGMDKFVEWLAQAKTGADDLYVAMYRVGEQIGRSLQSGAESWAEYGAAVKDAARQFITAEIAKSVAAAITTALVAAGSLGPVGLALIPVLVGLALGAANTAINQIPALASGGLAYGDTLAQVGEYPGASSNPEVIAPLNKLKSILGDSGGVGGGEVTFRIDGMELVGVLNKVNRKQKIT